MKIFSFFKTIGNEWNHIKWPTSGEVTRAVIAVMVISGLVAYYLGFLDVALSKLLALIIG